MRGQSVPSDVYLAKATLGAGPLRPVATTPAGLATAAPALTPPGFAVAALASLVDDLGAAALVTPGCRLEGPSAPARGVVLFDAEFFGVGDPENQTSVCFSCYHAWSFGEQAASSSIVSRDIESKKAARCGH